MLTCIKVPNRFIYLIGAFVGENLRLLNTVKPFAFFENCPSQIRLYRIMQSKGFLITNYQGRLSVVLNKFRSKRVSNKNRDEYEISDDDDDDDDVKNELENEDNYPVGKDVEVITRSLNSMRTDLILKSILNINRKKVEEYFYQNKIRINGKILLKKSQNAKIGDEIDIIYGTDNLKLKALKIGRVKIVEAEKDPDNDKVTLKVLKSKSLIINSSSYEDVWREPINQE